MTPPSIPRADDLPHLAVPAVQALLRDLLTEFDDGHVVLARLLGTGSPAVRDALVRGLSPRLADGLLQDAAALGADPVAEEEAWDRIDDALAVMAARGDALWPDEDGDGRHDGEPDHAVAPIAAPAPSVAETGDPTIRPAPIADDTCWHDPAAVAVQIVAWYAAARRDGATVLGGIDVRGDAPVADHARVALAVVTDALVSIDRAASALETHAATLLDDLTRVLAVLVDGCAAIAAGESARGRDLVVGVHLTAAERASDADPPRPEGSWTPRAVASCLRVWGQCADREGRAGLLAAAADLSATDPVAVHARTGLELAAAGADAATVRAVLTTHRTTVVDETRRTLAMVRDAMLRLKRGECHPDLAQAVCAAYLTPADRARAAAWSAE